MASASGGGGGGGGGSRGSQGVGRGPRGGNQGGGSWGGRGSGGGGGGGDWNNGGNQGGYGGGGNQGWGGNGPWENQNQGKGSQTDKLLSFSFFFPYRFLISNSREERNNQTLQISNKAMREKKKSHIAFGHKELMRFTEEDSVKSIFIILDDVNDI